jgi:L-iditol 2-dehydrogenase
MPKPGHGQVLLRILATAICTVDQRAYRGVTHPKFPVVQGHEAVGEVVELGEGVTFLQLGDHVILGRHQCFACRNCRKGENGCLDPSRIPFNYFSEYIVRDVPVLTKVSKDVPAEWAAIGEPISCVVHSIKRSRLKAGETCAIIGAGIMGLLHTQIAKDMGAKVIVSEPDARRRERALQCGADFVVDPTKEDAAQFIKDHNDGFGADVVYFAIAIPKAFPQAMEMLDRAGRIICYSSQHPDEPVPLKIGEIHSREYEIIGTIGSTADDFTRAGKLLDEKKLKMDLVIDHILPFENFVEAFEKSIVPGTYRVVMMTK